MNHKLQVVAKVDVNLEFIELRVTGCLTAGGSAALLPLIRRAASMVGGRSVIVNLTSARHIDSDALDVLQDARSLQLGNSTAATGFSIPLALLHGNSLIDFRIAAPDHLPECPVFAVASQLLSHDRVSPPAPDHALAA